MAAPGKPTRIGVRRLALEARRQARIHLVIVDEPSPVPRPRSRHECAEVSRPCPFVSCKYHLYLDVNPETGTLTLNFPHLEPHELAESCARDVAERYAEHGGLSLGEVGERMNLTRERVRQIEEVALAKMHQALRNEGDDE